MITGDGESGLDSGEGAWEMATTSKEGSRRVNYSLPTRRGSDNKYQWYPFQGNQLKWAKFKALFASNNWRASLVPAAAVIPAPRVYTKAVAVKTLVVWNLLFGPIVFRSSIWDVFGEGQTFLNTSCWWSGHNQITSNTPISFGSVDHTLLSNPYFPQEPSDWRRTKEPKNWIYFTLKKIEWLKQASKLLNKLAWDKNHKNRETVHSCWTLREECEWRRCEWKHNKSEGLKWVWRVAQGSIWGCFWSFFDILVVFEFGRRWSIQWMFMSKWTSVLLDGFQHAFEVCIRQRSFKVWWQWWVSR